jgi:hypothetical protein
MDMNKLAESLSSHQHKVPDEIAILALRRPSIDDLHRKLKKLLKSSEDVCGFPLERGHWTRFDDRTLVRLPNGGYAAMYHASGALKLFSGMAPMDNLCKETPSRESMVARTEDVVKQMGLMEQLPRGQSLAFERLWQIKAAGVDRSGKQSETVVCRSIAAYRHFIGDVAVLGAASVTVKMAGDQSLDSMTMHMRGPAVEPLETAKTIHPEKALRQILQKVTEKLSHAKEKDEITIEADRPLQFGYINLGKRKPQRLLAPAYVASISVTHAQEAQAFMVVVPATERPYMSFEPETHESPVMETGKMAGRCCC